MARLLALVIPLLAFLGAGSRALAAETSVADSNVFVELAKKAVPSVVNISTLTTIKAPYPQGGPDEFFRRFFEEFFGRQPGPGGPRLPEEPGTENEGPPQENIRPLPKAISLGSGFIIDPSGIILTNNHVVSGAGEIKIQFTETPGETPADGEVIGRDPELDVALIRAKTQRKLVPLQLGDSESAQVGEYVMAVGNPFGQGHSVTHGIISAKGRVIPETPIASFLQTDAPINPGNSGGPLLNLRGEVIGINAAIVAQAQGIGFAIPINLVKSILPQLKTKGVVTRGYIGVVAGPLTPEIAEKLGAPKDLAAPFVTQVYRNGPADRAGIRPYDIIEAVDGKAVHSPSELIAAVIAIPVGKTARFKILREGKELEASVELAPRPSAEQQAEEQAPPGRKSKQRTKALAGMTLEDLTPALRQEIGARESLTGALVASVAPGSPAEQAGLMSGDVIVEVDRKPIKSSDALRSALSGKGTYLLRARRPGPAGQDIYNVLVLKIP